MIVTGDDAERDRIKKQLPDSYEVIAASTPLDVICMLESEGPSISTLVLCGLQRLMGSASDDELASFVDESYPWVRVVSAAETERVGGESVEHRPFSSADSVG